jgi:hypothetical protein
MKFTPRFLTSLARPSDLGPIIGRVTGVPLLLCFDSTIAIYSSPEDTKRQSLHFESLCWKIGQAINKNCPTSLGPLNCDRMTCHIGTICLEQEDSVVVSLCSTRWRHCSVNNLMNWIGFLFYQIFSLIDWCFGSWNPCARAPNTTQTWFSTQYISIVDVCWNFVLRIFKILKLCIFHLSCRWAEWPKSVCERDPKHRIKHAWP